MRKSRNKEIGKATSRQRLAPAARRALIETAATRVFAERGFEAATMQEIARAAGVVASVIYDYYQSKRELYVALLERHGQALIEETISAPVGSNLLPGLRSRIDGFLRAIEGDPFMWRLMFRDPPGDVELGVVHSRVQAEASRAIAAVLATDGHGFSSGDSSESAATAVVAEMIKSSLTGLAAWWWEHQEVNRADLTSIASALLWDGLGRFPGKDG